MISGRRLALPFLLAALLACAQAPAQTVPGVSAAGPTTTIVVVRHAEKATDDPRDPSLSPAGQERAKALAAALADASVSAVFTTELKRTWLTAEPAAQRAGLAIQKRPLSGDIPAYAKALSHEILTQQAGKTVLVVGHSNTVPAIVTALSGDSVGPIEDSEYDHLFIVTVSAWEGRVVKARYGAANR